MTLTNRHSKHMNALLLLLLHNPFRTIYAQEKPQRITVICGREQAFESGTYDNYPEASDSRAGKQNSDLVRDSHGAGGSELTFGKFKATVSAYTCEKGQRCIDASGGHPVPGKTLACPRRFHFGTQFFISDRIYRCTDRLALRFDSRFDLFVSTTEEALRHGLKTEDIVEYRRR